MAAVLDRRRPDPAQGVFETLLIVDGRPIELDAHLARLRASLAELFPDRSMPDLGELDLPSAGGPYGSPSGSPSATSGEGRDRLGSMRITVAPDGASRLEAQVSIREIEPELLFDPPPIALRSLPLARGLGAHKWRDRSLIEEAQSRLAGALPLIVAGDGTVLEAARANLFAVRGETLLTPPADGRLLPGITRMRVLEIAAAATIDAREAELSRDDLLAADEVFLTGSVRGVERVAALDGRALFARGEIADRIAAELRQTWAGAKVG
jgi:para-aminobenzoate synthetase / 4-amino-4-deoxychorismate lyase